MSEQNVWHRTRDNIPRPAFSLETFKSGIRPMIHGFIISALVVVVALLVEMAMGIV